MTIVWQGENVGTQAATAAAFLEEKGVDASKCVVEWNGEAYAPGDDLSAVRLEEGGRLDAFKVVAGG